MTLSRRQCLFLVLPGWVGGHLLAFEPQGLGQFATNAGPPCSPEDLLTPAVAADATYRKGSPARTTLIEPGMAGTPLELSGTVSGLTCGRIKGATVDFWQADARGVYDTVGFRLRGRQTTDAEGRFKVVTIVPGNAGTRARHIGLNVTVPGKANFWTEVFFPDDPKNATDPRFKKELLVKILQAPKGRQAALFDVVLKL